MHIIPALYLILLLLPTSFALVPLLMNGTYNEVLSRSLNSSVEYIIGFDYNEMIRLPIRVTVSSENAEASKPLMIVVRQPKQVLSWQLPLIIDGDKKYMVTSRTLCPDNQTKISIQDPPIYDDPIITISTASEINISFHLNVSYEEQFFIEPNVQYNTTISPSAPHYFFYPFATNISDPKRNFDTVILEVDSNSEICMIVSIQNYSCPVFDLNEDITYSGFYETVSTKGGITIPKDKFPRGFYVVFVAKGDDSDCGTVSSSNNRTKDVIFSIKPSITYNYYFYAVLATLGCIFLFYVIFGLSFFFCSVKGYVPRSMDYVSDCAIPPTPSTVGPDFSDNISFDETEYDTIAEAESDHDIYLNKPILFLSDLARKDPRILNRKSYLYLYNVLTVALFYGLPVVQLVITYQTVLNNTGQQDLCYYNFLCAHPLGFISDFNHLFSNIGYIAFGALFIWIVYRRELSHKDLNFERMYGIPQHYGMFYAMGVALIMEGVLSGSYHICPSQFNFQFDSSFMYVIAVLSMVKLYQNRHPDINATAYATFGVLAIAILLGMIGILETNIYFWIFFTIIHITACIYLTAQIYYMGCCKLNKGIFLRIYRIIRYDFFNNPVNFLKPRHKARMVLLVIGNIFNWVLAYFGLYYHQKDFAIYLLAIFMSNTLLYFVFYIVMKLIHRERLNKLSFLFLVLSFACAVSAMYFFLHKSISWAKTPAQSRQYNTDCKLLSFYDNHDIWHFLSAIGMFFSFMMLLTLDDDLSHTNRCKIPVF